MTLNNLIDDILLIIRNNNIAESEKISRVQIEHWIQQYRLLFLRREINKGYDINYDWITVIPDVHISRVEDTPGHFEYCSDYELPKLMDTARGTGLLTIKDMYGNIIQLGNETKMKFQKYRRNTCKDYIAYVKNNRVYVEGGSNMLEYIQIECLLEDPTKTWCFNPDEEYPIPYHLIPEIRQMILKNELGIMVVQPSDETNNSKDDTQNRVTNGK